jgi:hypothetical protein
MKTYRRPVDEVRRGFPFKVAVRAVSDAVWFTFCLSRPSGRSPWRLHGPAMAVRTSCKSRYRKL